MNLKALALLSITAPLFLSFAQANQDNVSLVCHAAADSYWSGRSFDLTFVNDLSKIEYVNACFAACRKGQKPQKKWDVQDVTESGMKIVFSPSPATPKDSQYYDFDFETLEMLTVNYQVPWPGTDESFKAMGFKGKPNRDWKRVGLTKYKCNKKRTKIIE